MTNCCRCRLPLIATTQTDDLTKEATLVESYLKTVLSACASDVAIALKVTTQQADNWLHRAYRDGLIARVARGRYSVRVREYRAEREHWGFVS